MDFDGNCGNCTFNVSMINSVNNPICVFSCHMYFYTTAVPCGSNDYCTLQMCHVHTDSKHLPLMS